MKKFVLFLVLACFAPALQASDIPRVVQFKAAYLFKIARFVEWRESPQLVQVCLAPDSDLAAYQGLLQGRDLGANRQITVDVTGVAQHCHIYFGSLNPADEVAPRTLTISDTLNELGRSSVLQLFLQDGHLRFSVDQEELCDPDHPSGYQISAKLLQLARRQS